MTFIGLVAKSASRNGFRALMTVLGGAVAVIAFVTLRTVISAWAVGAEYAAKDRLSVRNKVSFALPLPKRYFDDIVAGTVPGMKSVTYCDWFGGRWAKDPNEFFANVACADNAFDVYPEISVLPGVLAKWKADKRAAVVGDMLAKKLGLRAGDKMTLEGSLYPGTWEFTIAGTYTAPPQSAIDRSTLFFRWDYMNDGVAPEQKDLVGWIFVRVDEPAKSAQVGHAIDALFEDRDVQTATMSEREANSAVLGTVGDVMRAIDAVSVLILVIMMLVLGNTIAMGVRERTTEYAVLRALGFEPRHIQRLIVGEALAVSLAAGALGLALGFPFAQLLLGSWLEENMGQFFPAFRVPVSTMVEAFLLTLLSGVVASLIPAVRTGRMSVTEALRREA